MTTTLTELIFQTTSPFDNPYQGEDKRVLFVCSAGLLRSATGARVYAEKYNTRAAGSEEYALIPLTANLLAWAQEIVFVNNENYTSALVKWPVLEHKKVVILDIPDKYPHMHPELVSHFKAQYE